PRPRRSSATACLITGQSNAVISRRVLEQRCQPASDAQLTRRVAQRRGTLRQKNTGPSGSSLPTLASAGAAWLHEKKTLSCLHPLAAAGSWAAPAASPKNADGPHIAGRRCEGRRFSSLSSGQPKLSRGLLSSPREWAAASRREESRSPTSL